MPLRMNIGRRKIAVVVGLCAIVIAALICGLPAATRLINRSSDTSRTKSLNHAFPIVEGHYQATKLWSFELPERYNQRLEDDTLVIWRPGLTFWFSFWKNDHNQSQDERLAELRARMSAEAFDVEEVRDNGLIRLSYRLNEKSRDKRAPAFYAFVVGDDGHVRMGVYFDKESDVAIARTVVRSVTEANKP